MAEGKRVRAALLGWRLIVMIVVAIVAANGLALLLIPQLSGKAAVRGGMTAIGVFLGMQLALRIAHRSRQSKR